MRLETKFLRLKTQVTIGSRFDDWQVCWLGQTGVEMSLDAGRPRARATRPAG